MKAAIEMKAETRKEAGKGAARAARRAGFIPVAVYGKDKENLSLNVEARLISNEYFRGGFMNKIVALNVGGKNVYAIPREVQLNPVSDKIEHADFLQVDEKSTIKVRVPVHFSGNEKCVGIKRGGVLNIVAHEVELLCPAANIPAALDIDLAALDIGSSIHLADLDLPKGVSPAYKGRTITIASIAGRSKDEEPAAAAAPAAAVPASTAKAPAAAPAAGAAKPAAKK